MTSVNSQRRLYSCDFEVDSYGPKYIYTSIGENSQTHPEPIGQPVRSSFALPAHPGICAKVLANIPFALDMT